MTGHFVLEHNTSHSYEWTTPLTLLSEADHHELLADVSRATDRHHQLSDVLFNPVLGFRDEHRRLCFGVKNQQAEQHGSEAISYHQSVSIYLTPLLRNWMLEM